MVIIPPTELRTLQGLPAGGTIVELGNKKNASGVYREWYESKGYDYTSLDWNGLDGAVKIDMGRWFDKGFLGHITAVTNFGFTEHVFNDQEQCWRNILDMCQPGVYFCFCMPLPGHWETHGVYQPSLSWTLQWLERNGFETKFTKTHTEGRHLFYGQAVRTEVKPWFWRWHGIHITPASKRRNPEERSCGVE